MVFVKSPLKYKNGVPVAPNQPGNTTQRTFASQLDFNKEGQDSKMKNYTEVNFFTKPTEEQKQNNMRRDEFPDILE